MTTRGSMLKTNSGAAKTARDRDHGAAAREGYASQPVPRGAAKPLAPVLSEEMGRRFGEDFGGVRLHEGVDAHAKADALDARAYTFGEHIVLGRNAPPPDTHEGKSTLAHELAHVVQQRRGGPPRPNFDGTGLLEQSADRASAQVMSGTGPVAVAGAAAPSPMCQPDKKKRKKRAQWDDEEEREDSPRKQEKDKVKERKQQRATAGKSDAQLGRAEAERELRALEASYRKPGAQSRALKTKEADLIRFQKLLKLSGGTQLQKNQRQGAFDELQRTPVKTAGKPQDKYVAGGSQLPDQDLRAGKDSYAQPDYSIVRRDKDGKFQKLHVNLKSDKIDLQTPAKARATARAYLEQAIRNSRHLPDGDSIVISFARTPSKAVQEAMKAELFKKGSPVSELRFGPTTHKSSDYKPPATAASVGKKKPDGGKSKGKKKADTSKPGKAKVDPPKPDKKKADTSKPGKAKADPPKPDKKKADTSKPGKAKVDPPKPDKKKADTPKPGKAKADPPKPDKKKADTSKPNKAKADPPKPDKKKADPPKPAKIKAGASLPDKTATTTKPSVPVRTRLPAKANAGKAGITTKASPGTPSLAGAGKLPGGGSKITVSGARGGMPRGGGSRGGGSRGMAAAEGIGALVEAIAVPIINHYMQEHYAASIASEARELIATAIEEHRLKFEAMIEAQRAEIQKAQTEGRQVSIRVYVDTNWQDTDIGRVLTRAYVEDYQLTFEDGPAPKSHSIPRPGGWVGDLFRDAVGTSFSYETLDIALDGTDPDVADRRLRRKLIDAKLRSPKGSPEVAFESLIIGALENGMPLDDLHEYAVHRKELADNHPSAGPAMEESGRWYRMQALIDGSMEDLIVQAKAKGISLTMLRALAMQRSREAGLSSDAGTGPATAAYWGEVVRLIDTK